MVLLKQEKRNREMKVKILTIINDYLLKKLTEKLTISRIVNELKEKDNKLYFHNGILYHMKQLKDSGIITWKVKKGEKKEHFYQIEIIDKNWKRKLS